LTKPELGTKRDCPECSARFYDLHKEPALCPKCQHEFIPEALLKPRKTRAEEETPKDENEPEKNEAEVTLEDADEEAKAPVSKRLDPLDGDEEDDDDSDSPEDIPDIEGITVDIDDDDDNDTSLLEDEDTDNDDVAGIIGTTDTDED